MPTTRKETPAKPPAKKADDPARVREIVRPHLDTVGNLVTDPELAFTADGKPWLRARIAVTPRVRDDAGNWANGDTTFYDVVSFGPVAEHATESLRKGDRVVVVGRGEIERYTDKEGKPATAKRIVADEISPSLRWTEATLRRPNRTGKPAGEDTWAGTSTATEEAAF